MKYRSDLPQPIPKRLLFLPVQNGFPVPWFVPEIKGKYDFRIMDGGKLRDAIKRRCCWICGEKLGSHLAFPIGSMATINRTVPEPPSHTECAEWAIKACPFLVQRQDRRETHLPDGIKEPGGIAIARQPSAVCLWVTNAYNVVQLPNGLIFKIGDPLQNKWFKEGREATRNEVLESIDDSYSILYEAALKVGGNAVQKLEAMKAMAIANLRNALQLLPKE